MRLKKLAITSLATGLAVWPAYELRRVVGRWQRTLLD